MSDKFQEFKKKFNKASTPKGNISSNFNDFKQKFDKGGIQNVIPQQQQPQNKLEVAGPPSWEETAYKQMFPSIIKGQNATIQAYDPSNVPITYRAKEAIKGTGKAAIYGFGNAVTFGAVKKNQEEVYGKRNDFNRTTEQHPIAYGAGELGGYLIPGGVAEKGAGLVIKGASIAPKLLRGAIAGGVVGGGQSAIDGDSVKGIAKNTLLGAGLGVIGEGIGMGISKGIGKLKNVKLPSLFNKSKSEVAPTMESSLAKTIKNPKINTPLSEETQRFIKQIDLDNEGAVTNTHDLGDIAKRIKDKASQFGYNNQDIYRNFEDAFGKDAPIVKKMILDPLDQAKGNFVKGQAKALNTLKSDIVDKLGIKKGSKESGLVQKFGEGNITENELRTKYPKVADKVIEADKWFRNKYDKLIDEVNTARSEIYPNNPDKLVPKRKDYYHHFKEMSDTLGGLKNLFDTPSQINPSLVGISEFTSPKSKFASFMQKRGLGEFKNDAVGGFINYVKAAEHAKHIDPQIPKIRQFAKDIAVATDQTKNANNLIGFLQNYANDLAGKTNPFDRLIQDNIPGGRKVVNVINAANNRVKANTVLGNISSSLSQIANVPQGIAFVKNPVQLSKGFANTMEGIVKKNPLYDESQFISERYSDKLYRQFDQKLIDQPKKLAGWMLEALDELGTKFIWNSTYQKAVAEGIAEPIQYADGITRKLVGGRGIGEVPLLQKSKLAQVIMPFTLEVNNLWKVQKDFIKAKDFAGLIMLYLGNHIINKGMEQVRGSGVVFDPIQALQDITTGPDKDKPLGSKVGRLTGEVVSNMPLGSTIAGLYPEYGGNIMGANLPTRKEFFGREDPTRFGSGIVAKQALTDPLYKLLPNWGGNQIKKTIQGTKAFNQGMVMDNNGDQLRYPIERNTSNKIKGALFGSSAFNESKDFYDKERSVLSQLQTEKFNKEVSKGKDPKTLYNTLLEQRELNKQKDKIQNEIKSKFPDKKVYLKKYETDSRLKKLNSQLKSKNFNWLKEN